MRCMDGVMAFPFILLSIILDDGAGGWYIQCDPGKSEIAVVKSSSPGWSEDRCS